MSIDDAPAPAPPADFITFPPFPAPPAGKRIIPFTEFKASGIQIAIDPEQDHVELDGIGVPTVALRVKHGLTEMEQRKKRKGKKTTLGPNGQVRRIPWWEEWEDGENLRTTTARVHVDRVNRIHIACQDFKSTRHWPGPESGLPQMWEVWRLYIGIISSIQPPPGQRKKNVPEPEPEEEVDSDDDFMDDKKPDSSSHPVIVTDDATARLRKRTEDEAKESSRKEYDAQAQERYERRQERKEANMTFFFDDPETFVKIFFSAHFRDKGFFVDNRNCRTTPILIEFFFRFILRNHVFPEYETKLRKALEVCQQARIQLPATSTIGKALPDGFSKGCEKLMGQFSQSIFQASILPSEDAEPETKKRKLNDDKESEELKNFKASIGDSLQFIDSKDPPVDHTAELLKDAIADNVDVNGAEVRPGPALAATAMGTIDTTTNVWSTANADATPPASNKSPWGASTSVDGGWNTDQNETGGWGTSQAYDTNGWGADPSGGTQWLDELKNELLELLGPTTLPLTHTTGIVMRSVRRIIKLIPPASGAGGKSKKHGGRTGTEKHPGEGVEAAFVASLGQVVTAPWAKIGNHIASDIQAPQILPDSRGACVPVPTSPNAAAETTTEPGAFDPMKDEFTWLVDMPVFEKLIEGMGVSGSWVQLARRDLSPEVTSKETEKDLQPQHDRWLRPHEQSRMGGPGTIARPTKFWYLEQCHSVLASFHTDRYYPDQDN